MRTVEEIIDTLNSIRNLPTLPAVMQKLSVAVKDPNSDAKSIAKLIEDDPAISTRILKVVNSSLYAGGVEIQSVQQAVARLGLMTTNNIALSTSIFSAFNAKSNDGFDRNEFWRHSISVGIAACVVYAHASKNMRKRHSKEVLRLAGLLHDIGKLIMDQYMADDFRGALAMAKSSPMMLCNAEQEVVGIDHATLGGWLCGKWNLSEELMLSILWHHDPDSAPDAHWELTAMCHVANYICNLEHIGDGGDLAQPTCVQSVWKRLGLAVSDISVIVDEVNEESKKSDILMTLM
ncbi:MAG TPA: hypothetical protein DCS43_15090 [Verrucomicrobia bacterium]|nr:hypothetical protein [Verrucomicrobiota bacterium]